MVIFFKNGFSHNFIDWGKRLLTNQGSCIINDGSNTSYFKLGARQGYQISAYLYIIALEMNFAMIKSNQNIKSPNISNHNYLFTAYVADTIFFYTIKNQLER